MTRIPLFERKDRASRRQDIWHVVMASLIVVSFLSAPVITYLANEACRCAT